MRKAAVQGWPKDDALFAGIGAFLHAHGLSPDPVHYAFAHATLTDPVMATAVARLTDGGIRLGRKDIEELGGMIAPLAGSAVPAEDRHAAELMAQTQAQFDEFVGLMRTFQSATSGFGRDLEQSAAAIQRQPNLAGIGHGVGDRVLSAIGQGLQTGCAGYFVARHGGEEFAVLIEGTTLSIAADLLDTARAELSARRFRDRVSGAALGRITLSAGVVALCPDEAIEAAFARADRLLYAAKADGRDRVCAG